MDVKQTEIKELICEWVNQIDDLNILMEVYSIIKQLTGN